MPTKAGNDELWPDEAFRGNFPVAAPLSHMLTKEQHMLRTLAYSASLPAIAIALMLYVSVSTGLIY